MAGTEQREPTQEPLGSILSDPFVLFSQFERVKDSERGQVSFLKWVRGEAVAVRAFDEHQQRNPILLRADENAPVTGEVTVERQMPDPKGFKISVDRTDNGLGISTTVGIDFRYNPEGILFGIQATAHTNTHQNPTPSPNPNEFVRDFTMTLEGDHATYIYTTTRTDSGVLGAPQ